jgi:hypothetical protein
MKVEEIELEALALTEGERGSLAAKLLNSLPVVDVFVSDEQVELRDAELTSGKVASVSHAEFVRRVQRERGQ